MIVYEAVSMDGLELPISQRDTISELAAVLGIGLTSAYRYMTTPKKYKIVKICLPDREPKSEAPAYVHTVKPGRPVKLADMLVPAKDWRWH